MSPLQQGFVNTSAFRQLTIRCLSLSLLISASAGFAQSSLLESVKRNPAEAKALCQSFKAMNSNGQSAMSPEAINKLASQRNLSANNAEILATYVIGMHCSDVR
ncbi:putative conserved secreted protein [Synechococcus sp. SYN20]|nr:putative conserved secreted protein [Synechococcus sp. SYN20]